MKQILRLTSLITFLLIQLPAEAKTGFGSSLCNNQDYLCITIKSGQTWNNLFRNAEERDIVRRINRMNTSLKAGMVIAIPQNLERLSIYDVSPFPRYVESEGEKIIYISQKELAFGAYDESGELIWWGPISSGIDGCKGATGSCETPNGSFRIIRKQDMDCISTAFPRRANGDNGGAEMPYCMHFYRGYALHGSAEVPGYRASHGCVRLFTEDARWLNEEFVGTMEEDGKGTRVVLDSPR